MKFITKLYECRREKSDMTYHDWENSVDFLHVVLILVKNINRDTGLLTAKAADATRFESLHNGIRRINLSGRVSQ